MLVNSIIGALAQDTVDCQNVNKACENYKEKFAQVTTPIDNRRSSSFDVTPVILFMVVLVMSVSTGLKLVLTRNEDVSDEGANFAGFVTRQVG